MVQRRISVSIPKRVSEALKRGGIGAFSLAARVSIPKRVSEALKLKLTRELAIARNALFQSLKGFQRLLRHVRIKSINKRFIVSITKRVSEALKH